MTCWKSPVEETKKKGQHLPLSPITPSQIKSHGRGIVPRHSIKPRALHGLRAAHHLPRAGELRAAGCTWQGPEHPLASHAWSDVSCSSGAGLDTRERLGELLHLLRVSGAVS